MAEVGKGEREKGREGEKRKRRGGRKEREKKDSFLNTRASRIQSCSENLLSTRTVWTKKWQVILSELRPTKLTFKIRTEFWECQSVSLRLQVATG